MTRYRLFLGKLREHAQGEWVRVEDVEALLAPFVAVVRGIPDNWPERCQLRSARKAVAPARDCVAHAAQVKRIRPGSISPRWAKGDARVSDSTPLYSVGTWDTDLQAYTPQIGVGRSINVTLAELRQRVRELRNLGYSVHRRRDADGTYDDFNEPDEPRRTAKRRRPRLRWEAHSGFC